MHDEEKPDHIPSIAAAMTPFPWVIGVERSLEDARAMMRSHGIRHLPVVENEELVGVLSATDLELAELRAPERAGRDRITVREACRQKPYIVDMATPLDVVLVEMAGRRIEAALVTRDGRIAGIFTTSDACRHFSEFLRTMFPEPGDDEIA